MDNRRFDALTRSFATGSNRRQVLKGVLGLGVGTVAGARLLTGDVDAARRGYSGPSFLHCHPHCDGTTCGDDGCGGTCRCADSCYCLAEVLAQFGVDAPEICVASYDWLNIQPCTNANFACDSNSAYPICEPESGACVEYC